MKNLRQLIRRSGLLSNGKRRRRNEKPRSSFNARPLTSETLEKRQLLAGDVLAPQHNYWNSYDVNDDGQITARDALAVINRLSQNSVAGEGELGSASTEDGQQMFYDVNADHEVTALDALSVVNAISRGEEVGELIELQLRALRDPADLSSQIANGESVDVNEIFHLEVSFDDLRLFNDRLGAFQLFTDIAVSQPDVLRPVLNETQRIIIGEEFTQAPFPTSITFGIETPVTGSTVTSVDSPFADFANDSVGEITRVLTAFGYTPSQFSVETLSFDNNDLGFEISYLGLEFGNVDVPDFTIEVNESVGAEVPTQFIEFAPFEADGVTPNSDAVQFNINSFSRTFNDNEEFYSNQNGGAFDFTNGFTGVGGLGQIPTSGGGIPQLTDDGGFIEPFDAFSIPVQIISPVTNLEISVNPGEDLEATLLYGRDEAVPQDLVLIDEDAVVTLSAGAVSVGVVADDATIDTVEDMAETVDLSTLVSSGTADSFTVTTSGNLGSAVIAGNILTYTPNADANGTDTVVYTATSGASSDTGTLTVNIAAVNDAPEANDDSFQVTTGEMLVLTAAQLLTNDTDVDGDSLTVTAVGATAETGSTVVLSGETITYTPASGITSDSFTYTISDGSTTDTATVNITIIDMVEVPVLMNGQASVDEDNILTFDLSTLVTTGPVSTFDADDGLIGASTVSGSTLTYEPDPDEFGPDEIFITASNSAGTSDTVTLTVTVNPINDPPNAQDDTATVGVDDVSVTINVLENDDEGADNEDTDVLNIDAVSDVDAGATAVINGGTTITYTPAPGLTGTTTDTFSYTISDGNGGTATANVVVTINRDVPVDPPVVVNGSLTVQQNANATIDLATLVTGEGPITFAVTSPTASGSAVLSGSVVTYTPNANFVGSDSIAFTATNDGGTTSGSVAVTVTAVAPVNNPPTANNVTVAAVEDTPTSFDILTLSQASANDAGQTLSITNVSGTSNGGTATLNSSGGIDYSPAADFNGLETFTVTIADSGPAPNTVSIVVSVDVAAVDDPVTVAPDPIVSPPSFGGASVTVNVLQGASAGPADESQTLIVQNVAVPTAQGTVVNNNNGTVTFTPAANFIGQATISFDVSDGNSVAPSTATVSVQEASPVSISGSVFIDQIDNLDQVIFGEAPSRNGARDANEAGVGGITVRLVNSSTGETVASVVTEASGDYTFANVAPGTYTINFELPETISVIGTTVAPVTVTESGASLQPSLALAGTNNSGLETINILSSSFLQANTAMAQASNGGRQGGLVSIGDDGLQSFIIMNEGFDGTTFAELLLNDSRDAALLVIAREGATTAEVAALDENQFVVTADGRGVQFYGGLEDFDFQSTAGESISAEFAGFQAAVDAAFTQLGS